MASAVSVTDPKTITRVPLAHVDDIAEQLRADVLERARQQFGYRADTLAAQGPLGAALRQLEIAPLHEAEVRLYMQSKEKNWESFWHSVKYRSFWKKWTLGPAESPISWWLSSDGRRHYPEDAIYSYPRFIPVHALEIALQVKSAVPEAVLHVHELTLKVKKVAKPLPDPFLSVVLGSEEYFVAVWDERDYEVRP